MHCTARYTIEWTQSETPVHRRVCPDSRSLEIIGSMPEIRKCSVYASSILPASVGEVWNVVGPFDGIPSWLPVEECVLAEGTGPATKVGCGSEPNQAPGTRT